MSKGWTSETWQIIFNSGGTIFTNIISEFIDLALHEAFQVSYVTFSFLIRAYIYGADDLVLFSTSPEGLQCQIDKLFTYCRRWQLIVNTAKTRIMCFNRPTRRKEQHTVFYFNDEEIEIVPKYKYVGCVFSSAGNVFSNHVEYTLEKARKAMFSIYKYGYYLGQQPSGVFCKLFDSLVWWREYYHCHKRDSVCPKGP